jgi:hypothetical protein
MSVKDSLMGIIRTSLQDLNLNLLISKNLKYCFEA